MAVERGRAHCPARGRDPSLGRKRRRCPNSGRVS
jgi:hypothetical protein